MKFTKDQLSKIKEVMCNPKFTYSERVQKIKEIKERKSPMREYTWDPEFYNEIIKDWNYRFPKFSYTQYPKYGKEDNNYDD